MRVIPLRSFSNRSIPVKCFPAFSRSEDRLPWFLKGGFPLQWTAYIKQPIEYMSEAGSKTSSNAYSGAALDVRARASQPANNIIKFRAPM